KLKVKFQKQADGTWKIKHFQTQNIFSRPVSHWHSEAELPVPSQE
ncbi:nuclear transport factor 2 family protein, partial [Acinetobacter baumannii]